MNETATAFQAAVEANHFGVMQVHNLKATMTKKGVEFERDCLIFEVCQPQTSEKGARWKYERLYSPSMPDLDL